VLRKFPNGGSWSFFVCPMLGTTLQRGAGRFCPVVSRQVSAKRPTVFCDRRRSRALVSPDVEIARPRTSIKLIAGPRVVVCEDGAAGWALAGVLGCV
jgi:hypothetical protein